MKPLIIYMPLGACDVETQYKLRISYPKAEFSQWYRDGMLMWQDALARVGG